MPALQLDLYDEYDSGSDADSQSQTSKQELDQASSSIRAESKHGAASFEVEAEEPIKLSDAPTPKGPAVCGICETAVSKYKCSRCRLPYCSVACNKEHLINHPPEPPEFKPAPTPEAPPRDTVTEGDDPSNPFQALDTSEQLTWLFRKYPDLPQQLLDIHSATQPPPNDPSRRIPASLAQGMPVSSNWNRDLGIKRGKAALRRARHLPGAAGEGVREYCTLIQLLLSDEDSDVGPRAMLQQQFAHEDANMVRLLLQQDNIRQ